MVNVAILGYGVVGSGVAEVIKKNSESIRQRAGTEIKVKWILDIRDFPGSPDKDVLTKNADDVFNDSEVSIVVETIGGARIAHEFTKRALMAGKSVVTSNKELVATHGPELLQMAKENGVSYLFEASVGGGIPIIRPLNQCLAANEINGITGILNGTTNYILTQMKKEGKSFEAALKEAQQNGYAEQNPTADVEGHDACRKIAILSSIAYNEFVDCENIYTEGITKITVDDMKYADAIDGVIKLIAVSKKSGGKIFARVSPAIVRNEHPLSNVEDVFNAIVVNGDAVGDAMFYGRGAGKLPTASAVVADVIDIAKHPDSGTAGVWVRTEENNILPIEESTARFLVRVNAKNIADAKKDILSVFGETDFVELHSKANDNEFAFISGKIAESEFAAKLDKLESVPDITVLNRIRIEE
ncbi:homoserine dehydrogenase [Ruminiclostridium papyrosolvens DSM 2782]|uniref:Homoserine dehydrogenase n=1 Tax=Ruminiclostridium papyrosolvens DSM 2782 TaxID=588581 RepID=F1T9N5_9FIRM|nr:homoserine dehydrogenase [Ruminiclostridium papyrosolvens]EGD49217.1 homoserine dehydrogenase [Ruminiclostridium papyrosolvens DSM 2782]WES35695.1 homoserine dehydrogenase [Ruminiclostridium papyrosolvens DSM 2782]